MKKEPHEQKRKRLEAKLNEIGLTNYVVFEEFIGEILPAVYGDSTEILSTVLKALDPDPIFQKTFFAMIDGCH